MTFALGGLAIGFGTLFPQFETENAAQIPTSFGGLLLMMTSVALIGVVVLIEATPVYRYLSAIQYGASASGTEMIAFFAIAAAICLTATIVPLRIAQRRLELVER